MKTVTSIVTACIFGVLLAQAGSHITGYTAAFAMPESFAGVMWLWDIFVIQFLGFGLLGILLAFIHVKLFAGSLLTSVLVPLIVCQLVLLYPFTYPVYWTNFLVILVSLVVGFFAARATHNRTLNAQPLAGQ